MSSPLDVLNRERKPKADPNVPTIGFDLPPLTTEQIVDSVQNNKPLWRSLLQAAVEDEVTKRAKKLSDLYDLVEIEQPEFEPREFGI